MSEPTNHDMAIARAVYRACVEAEFGNGSEWSDWDVDLREVVRAARGTLPAPPSDQPALSVPNVRPPSPASPRTTEAL
jgi:hypothetical protein